MRGLHPAAAGAVAATVWGLLEPIDQRLAGSDYSDIAFLGKGVTRGGGWRAVGFTLHAVNGAVFGLVYDAARSRVPIEARRLALGMALVTFRLQDGVIREPRVAVGGIEPQPRRIADAEQLLAGRAIDRAIFEAAAAAVASAVDPLDDAATSATYRRDLARTVTRRALEQAAA